jgi:hypothetical protein
MPSRGKSKGLEEDVQYSMLNIIITFHNRKRRERDRGEVKKGKRQKGRVTDKEKEGKRQRGET